MKMQGMSDHGLKRVAMKMAQANFDLDAWVDEIFEDVVFRAGTEVPDEFRTEAYNTLSEMLKIEE